MKKTVVVMNPMAANGSLGKRWTEVQRVLEGEIGPFETAATQGSRDATRLARDALAGGADVVVAIGGDGTIHEVVNGFFDGTKPVRPEAAMGIIPFGTGGDFRKTVGLSHDIAAGAAVIKAGRTRRIDVGHLEYTVRGGGSASCVFINIASFGIGGLVDELVNTTTKAFGGRATFMLATLRAGIRYKNQRVRMVFDGREDEAVETVINNVAVANGRYFGGGMFVAPHAELDDGKLDVVTIGDMTMWDFVLRGRHLYRGTHLQLPKISSRRASRVEARPVNAADQVLLDVDGEAPGSLPATFTLLPRSLPLIVPHGEA